MATHCESYFPKINVKTLHFQMFVESKQLWSTYSFTTVPNWTVNLFLSQSNITESCKIRHYDTVSKAGWHTSLIWFNFFTSSLPYYTNVFTYANVLPKAMLAGLAAHANAAIAMVTACWGQFTVHHKGREMRWSLCSSVCFCLWSLK